MKYRKKSKGHMKIKPLCSFDYKIMILSITRIGSAYFPFCIVCGILDGFLILLQTENYGCNLKMMGNVNLTSTTFPLCLPGSHLGIDLIIRMASSSNDGSTPRTIRPLKNKRIIAMSFPFTKQPDAMDCGPACLCMIAEALSIWLLCLYSTF